MQHPQRAAELIWQHLVSGEPMGGLPDDLRPASRAEGYAIQACLVQTGGQVAVRGWKIAATSEAGREHIGVSAPLAGRIMAPFVHAPGATLPTLGNRMGVAELEFAFVMGVTLPPRPEEYAVQEVLDAVAGICPAIEVPSSRFDDFVHAGEAQLIADLACAGHFVFGEPGPADWRTLDLRAHPVHGTILRAGQPVLERTGSGVNVLGDPRLALTWLTNELSHQGIALEAGQVVSTGTCMVPMTIEAGDEIHGDFGVLGRIQAGFGRPGDA
ncbi:MAG: hydratase [Burkholderiaceae bacterium]